MKNFLLLLGILVGAFTVEAHANMCIITPQQQKDIIKNVCTPVGTKIGTFVNRDIRPQVVKQATQRCGKILVDSRVLSAAACGQDPVALFTSLAKAQLRKTYNDIVQ